RGDKMKVWNNEGVLRMNVPSALILRPLGSSNEIDEHHLRRVIGSQPSRRKSFCRVLVEIENGAVNSRPLVAVG
ncbi:hypothetical protein AVEN_271593-1, partial [Araneus ventricosus]